MEAKVFQFKALIAKGAALWQVSELESSFLLVTLNIFISLKRSFLHHKMGIIKDPMQRAVGIK